MSIRPVSWKGFNAWTRSDWINPFGYKDFNWVDFTFAHVSLEWDRRFGNFDGHFALLGLHLGFSWHFSLGDAEFIAGLEKTMKEWGITDSAPDEYAADDTYPAHIECPEAHMGNVISPVGAQSFQPYDEMGGESGWSQAIKEAHEDSPQAMNWVDQSRDGS